MKHEKTINRERTLPLPRKPVTIVTGVKSEESNSLILKIIQ